MGAGNREFNILTEIQDVLDREYYTDSFKLELIYFFICTYHDLYEEGQNLRLYGR